MVGPSTETRPEKASLTSPPASSEAPASHTDPEREESDAICVVVSEETGTISVAKGGELTRNYEEDSLRAVLRESYRKGGLA